MYLCIEEIIFHSPSSSPWVVHIYSFIYIFDLSAVSWVVSFPFAVFSFLYLKVGHIFHLDSPSKYLSNVFLPIVSVSGSPVVKSTAGSTVE